MSTESFPHDSIAEAVMPPALRARPRTGPLQSPIGTHIDVCASQSASLAARIPLLVTRPLPTNYKHHSRFH